MTNHHGFTIGDRVDARSLAGHETGTVYSLREYGALVHLDDDTFHNYRFTQLRKLDKPDLSYRYLKSSDDENVPDPDDWRDDPRYNDEPIADADLFHNDDDLPFHLRHLAR